MLYTMKDDRGFTYRYIEKQTRCDIFYQNKNEFFSCNICVFLYVLYVLIKYISMRHQNTHNAANICSKNNILYINMKIIYFTLSIISS